MCGMGWSWQPEGIVRKESNNDAFSSHRSWVKQVFSSLFGNEQSLFSLKVLSAATDMKKAK